MRLERLGFGIYSRVSVGEWNDGWGGVVGEVVGDCVFVLRCGGVVFVILVVVVLWYEDDVVGEGVLYFWE